MERANSQETAPMPERASQETQDDVLGGCAPAVALLNVKRADGYKGGTVWPPMVKLRAGEITLGRDESCDVTIGGSGSMSGSHACLFIEEDGSMEIQDLDSKHGTFIGGRRLVRGERCALDTGRPVRLADVLISVNSGISRDDMDDDRTADMPPPAPRPARAAPRPPSPPRRTDATINLDIGPMARAAGRSDAEVREVKRRNIERRKRRAKEKQSLRLRAHGGGAMEVDMLNGTATQVDAQLARQEARRHAVMRFQGAEAQKEARLLLDFADETNRLVGAAVGSASTAEVRTAWRALRSKTRKGARDADHATKVARRKRGRDMSRARGEQDARAFAGAAGRGRRAESRQGRRSLSRRRASSKSAHQNKRNKHENQ